jgi:hypothetical protein
MRLSPCITVVCNSTIALQGYSMPLRPAMQFVVAALLALSSLSTNISWADEKPAAEEQLTEKQLAVKLRGRATNVQFNKDDTVRLIRFSKPSVTDETLKHLQSFPKIDYLAVVCPQVTDTGIENVAGLTNLDTLLLSTTAVTDAGLAALKDLSKLERLYLADTAITDAGLKHLAGLEKLTTLSLERTDITDAGLQQLSGLKNLETLLLDGTNITDDGLAHLAVLGKLRHLYLSNCKIGGPGVSHLKPLEKLESLSLSSNAVGNDAVKVIAAVPSLKHVELYETGFTREGIVKLRGALPKTGVYVSLELAATSKTNTNGGANVGATNATETPPNEGAIQAPIEQRLADAKLVPDLQRHVIPLLGRLGCNGRSCHGSFQGQGEFRLSMFGYDFEMDHKNLLERVDLKQTDESLILSKPTSEDEHGGGVRFSPGSWQQNLLRRWIKGGARSVGEKSAQFMRLDVSPTELVFKNEGEEVQLRVVSVWSDGSREDVTPLARFESKNDAVAKVSPSGLVTSTGQGDAYIITFYDNGIESTQAVLPVSEQVGDKYPAVPTPTPIDKHVVAKLKKLGVTPSALCTDEEFLRRVSLDLVGTLPTLKELREFLAADSPDKRSKKIEELLQRPAYVMWWTTKLCDLTGSNAGYLGGTEMAQPMAAQWRAWIERRVQENVGWDKIVADIILARSRPRDQPYSEFINQQSQFTRRTDGTDFAALDNPMPHFWMKDNIRLPRDKTLAFGYVFMGVRLECAECHKHPFDQWSKNDFAQFTQFFTRVKAGISPEAAARHEQMRNMLGVPVKLDTAALRRQSYLRIAAEGGAIPWKEVYVDPPTGKPQPAKLLGGNEIDLNDFEDPREPVMQWMLTEPNRYFAKSFVNRIWANYFNVGIIDPPDDLNLANPPSNKALLDYLVDEFIARGYDMKWLHRTITNSRTYQLSWRPNETNRGDDRNYSHAILRRLPAEVAVDAMIQATVNDAKLAITHKTTASRKIGQHPKSYQTRSIDFSLLVFGKPLRSTNCDCERQSAPTLLQALYIRNDQEMLERLDRSDGWLTQLKKSKPKPEQVDELIAQAYLRTLSRPPGKTELSDCREHITGSADIIDGLRDLLWALLNTQEFITNH